MKLVRPLPKSEVFLGYATHAEIGKVVPGRKPAKKFPYNTRLDSGRGTMQVCCKCFSRPSQGMCSAHAAEVYCRVYAAEAALKEADKRIAALEDASARGENAEVLGKALADVIALRHAPADKINPKPVNTP